MVEPTNKELLDQALGLSAAWRHNPDVQSELDAASAAVLARMVEPRGWAYRGQAWSAEKEAAAERVYSGFSYLPGFVPWVRGGNSDKQNEARDFVMRLVPAPAPQSGEAK